ncbi:MAG: acetylglutamate kinase [Thermoplasmata archaeon]
MIAMKHPWVLKVGGDELLPGPSLGQVALAVAQCVRRGQPVVLVHGGGDEATERAAALGLTTEWRRGQRVTSPEMLEVVAEVLGGRVNVRLVNALDTAGVPSVGLTGVSARLLPVTPAGDPPGSLGWVGQPIGARPRLLVKLLDEGFTPVVAPLGTDTHGGVYNVNADLAAASIAASLSADLLLLTDVRAVNDAQGRPIADLTVRETLALVEHGTARDGMIPKLGACAHALRRGARSAWIGPLAGLMSGGTLPQGGTRVGSARAVASPVPIVPPPASHGAP